MAIRSIRISRFFFLFSVVSLILYGCGVENGVGPGGAKPSGLEPWEGEPRQEDQCIGDFKDFLINKKDDQNSVRTLPLPNWEIVKRFENGDHLFYLASDFPTARDGGLIIVEFRDHETWLRTFQYFPLIDTEGFLFANNSLSQATGLIYQSKDGGLWTGLNFWDEAIFVHAENGRLPMLAKYDPKLEDFAFVRSSSLPLSDSINPSRSGQELFGGITFLFDNQDTFWILVEYEAIYKFDTLHEKLSKVVDIKDLKPFLASIANDGHIYFWEYDSDEIYRLLTDVGILELYAAPPQGWPIGALFRTSDGNLWVGAYSWYSEDDGWVVIEGNEERYKYGKYWWRGIYVVLESPDGTLWLESDGDGSSLHGMAWYRPTDAEGCWFSDYKSRIVEDHLGNLYIMIDNDLYKYTQ